VAELRATAETITPRPGPLPAATAEETERILRWLELPHVRLIEVEGEWTCPVSGATRYLDVAAVPSQEPTERALRPVPVLLRSDA
jgi:DNA polymerase-3 subunit epsilon